jgi:SAM-dependent methyltransferase
MNEVSTEMVKAFWDKRPCNIRHSMLTVGTKEYFDQVEKRKYLVEPHILEFADFPSWENKKVLEIGCGIGTDAVNFARHGANYTGVELSKVSLGLAMKRFEVYGLNGRFIEGDAETIYDVLDGEKFDFIYSFGVLHHTPSIFSALTEIRKLCGEQSIFKFMVYARNSWKNSMILAGLDQPEAQSGCPIANVYSKEEVEVLLNKTGFTIVEIEQDHIFPYKLDEYLNYRYVRQDWFAAMPSEVFAALEKQLGWHLLVSAIPR